MNIAEIRAKYPQYADIPDEELAKGFYEKFYADKMPIEEFYSKIGLSNNATSAVEEEPVTRADYYADKAKQGLVQGGEQFSNVGQRIRNEAYSRMPVLNSDTDPVSRMGETLRGALGVRNVAPPSDFDKYIGEGVKQTTDPTNWLGSGGIVRNILGSFLPGVFSETAKDVAEKSGAGSGVQTAAAIAGGLVGGGATAAVGRTGRGAAAAVKYGFTDALRENANKKVFSQAEQHVANTIKAAMEADPNLVRTIEELNKQAADIGVPLTLAALSDNPVILSSIRSIASRDPKFAAIFGREYDKAAMSLKQSADELFGEPTAAKAAMQEGLGKTRDMKAKRLQENLDYRAQAASNPVGPTPTKPFAPYYAADKLSEQSSIKMKVPEGDISPASRPLYAKADELGERLDANLSENSTREIWKTVAGDMKESPYSRFPSLFEKVKRVAAPIVDPQAPTTRQWNPSSYKETRSLQSAISAEYAALNPNSPTYRADREALSKLRAVVDESIAKDFPEELTTTLKAAGKQYAFDSNVRLFGRAVYDDKGIMNPDKVAAWLKDENNVRAMQKVVDPYTGKTLGELADTPAKMVARIMERKEYVNSLHTEFRKAQLADLAKMTPGEIVNKLYADDKAVSEFLRKYGKNTETLNALRSFMLDDIMNSKESLATLVMDKNKASAYNRIFGAGFNNKVNSIANMADRLKTSPADVKFDIDKGINKDWLEERVDVPASMVFSKLRNPIISKWQALVELSSRALTGSVNNEYERRMKQLLLDPKAFQDYAVLLSKADKGAVIKQDDLLSFLKKYGLGEAVGLGRNLSKGALIGSKVATDEQEP